MPEARRRERAEHGQAQLTQDERSGLAPQLEVVLSTPAQTHTQAEEKVVKPESEDWEVLRELEARLKSAGHALTTEEIATVRRAAAQVGLHDKEVQQTLEMTKGQAELVLEIRRRIREGSQRLMRAFTRAQQLLDQGNASGAKAVLESALAEEQIPFYRESVEAQMRNLGLR